MANSRAAPDPISATREALSAIERRLENDMMRKRIEFERFKEETLWRLNTMSDRTLEIAREEEDEAAVLARDRADADARFAEWKARLDGRAGREEFLETLTREAFESLLPSFAPSPAQAPYRPEGGTVP
jgi:hypothetical protein